MLVVMHSGQTGVERGAHRAALAAGLFIAGFMPQEMRDELGRLPDEVAEWLTPYQERGPRPALKANIALASGVIIVVPESVRAEKFPAIAPILQAARSVRVPYLACDPKTNLDDIVGWVGMLPETAGSQRVVITGPRETRWTEGEAVARRIVTAIAMFA